MLTYVGLDPMRYRTSTGGDERVFSGLDSQISDAERFKDASPFRVRCRHCQGQLTFLPINASEVSQSYSLQSQFSSMITWRQIFCFLLAQPVLRVPKPLLVVVSKHNSKFRFENISQNSMKDGLSVMTQLAITVRGWWAFTVADVFVQVAKDMLHSR